MCLTRGVIYKATVKHENKGMSYIGSKGRQFKGRYYEHMQNFRNKSKKHTTILSKCIHNIKVKEADMKNIIRWELLHRTKQNSPGKI